MNDYPLYDPTVKKVTREQCARRDELNQKIEDHFWFREIGFETVEMFTFNLRRRMNEIMPLYNRLYESESLEIDPLSTMRYVEHDTATGTGQATSQSTSDATSTGSTDSRQRSVVSETPQTRLSGFEDYASSATDVTGQTTTNSGSQGTDKSTSGSTSTTAADKTVSGYSGHTAELLARWRETFLNIDMMVIEELEPLFMMIYNNNSTYSSSYLHY